MADAFGTIMAHFRKIASATCIFISINAPAAEFNWLKPYLKSKAIRCDLTEPQLRAQSAAQIDFDIQKIEETLRARGSEFDSITQERDEFEIGIFPNAPVFDFYVLEKVFVVIQKLNFAVQTSYLVDNEPEPKTEKGLWFPLTVQDPGPGKTCTLSRIAYKKQDQRFTPTVNLVIGEPPSIVAADIVQVVDAAEDAPAPVSPAKPEAKANETPAHEPKPEKNESRARHHDHRRHYHSPYSYEHSRRRNHSYRHYRHYRHHQRSEDSNGQAPAQTAAAPPRKPGCTGNDSPWRSVACSVGIIK